MEITKAHPTGPGRDVILIEKMKSEETEPRGVKFHLNTIFNNGF
jgi:hypothetical protein